MTARSTTAKRLLGLSLTAVSVCLLGACATPPRPTDYSAFKESRPRSILVLPPVNNSPEVGATYSVYAQVTFPLAESGYYVMPVALVAETFKQNGLTAATDIHAVAPNKLREIFGADAALYIVIGRYGTSYVVVDSTTVVSASAKLIDLKTGQTLWTGAATASNSEGGNSSGGLVGMLVTAVVKQIMHSVTDASHPVAGIATTRLLFARPPAGLLYGPRSPKAGSD